MLKWDADSPVTFKASGKTVRDYEKRLYLEEAGAVPCDRKFRWSMLDEWETMEEVLKDGKGD